MFKDSEELTTFPTRFSIFKYLVMPFGLCNGPTSEQYLISDTLFNFLHCFIQIYFDNIFIYNKTLKKHHFHIQETKFLGLIISIKDI